MQLLENSENAIPFTLLGRLFDTTRSARSCPISGSCSGSGWGLDCVGLVGMVARHSPTVKEALSNLLLYMHLHDRGAVPTPGRGRRGRRCSAAPSTNRG
ncbi:MAG: AraC family transcriptional regulator ligand-binding domain-containing protein [Pseudomonadales bacterium]|nr:AraC family transcriptional regulator ligand-binding domain-containing protein [Pseudomonadales bacterium]